MPAWDDRCPKIVATSREEKTMTASAMTVIAKPTSNARRRGRNVARSGKSAARISVHPAAWCTNAERDHSHPFCSCTRKAVPDTIKAKGKYGVVVTSLFGSAVVASVLALLADLKLGA